MANDTTVYTVYPEADLDERVRYFDGQFLGSQDFVDAQRYLIDRLRRGFDLGTVAGVAAGLGVAETGAWTLKIAAGTAIDPRGRMLVLPEARENIDVPRELGGKAVDVALVYGEVEDRVQGGTAEEAGTRGATRIREVPSVIFYAAGQEPPEAGAVPLARLNVAADGTCAAVDPDPVRKRAGVSFPTEEGVEPPYLRAGGPARPRTLETDASVAIADKLIVGGQDPQARLDVRGLAKLDALHVRSNSFRVAGEAAKFYPIVWRDDGWADGALELEITRSNTNADATNAGSLVASFRVHGPNGSHGSAFVECELHQTKRFVAGFNLPSGGRVFVVWLRGDRTYSWRGSQGSALVDAAAEAKSVGGAEHAIKAAVDADFDFDRIKVSAPVDYARVRGSLRVDNDLSYGGTQNKLDTAEQGVATIRAFDLNFGHSTRHGAPGRALVDQKETLTLNRGGDWAKVAIQSPLAVGGDTSVGGDLTIGTDAERKELTVKGAISGERALTIAGFSHLKGGLTVGQDSDRKNLTVNGAVSIDQSLTVGAFAALKGHVTVGDDAERRTLTVSGKITGNLALSIGGDTTLGGTLDVAKAAKFAGNVNASGTVTVLREADQLQLHRARSEKNGGKRHFLRLEQLDTPEKKVPEVATSILFHHEYRYWHRIEGDSSGLHTRTGDLTKDTYAPLFTGALRVNGRATVNQLAVVSESFKVEGDREKFYPIVFNQDGWADGPYEFHISRPNVHTDGDWTGSMVSMFRGHMTNFGHGSNFHEFFANQFKQRFIADVHHHRESAQIVVWLRGNCTYFWRAQSAVSLVDFRAQRKKLGDEMQEVRDSIAGQYDKARIYVGPAASGMNEYDVKIVRGTVNAAGNKIAGGGFSVSAHSRHRWRKITYDTPFVGSVTVVATQQYPNDNTEDDSGDTRDNAIVVSSTKTHCYIKCGNGSGKADWRRFHFIAMGPG
jgi:hypothetical protein